MLHHAGLLFNAGLSRRVVVGFVPLVLLERSGGKRYRLSSAFSLSDAKGEPIIRWTDKYSTDDSTRSRRNNNLT
ncbi:hypothetical protein CLG94_01740 [Candidatus Methylomirabilis limnetica]|uniref:Uncharacterized protein n=1 Tax=Candidatus Methylomirabilis limnetica TaxID=2033718 RepID=A0A2T4U0W5_9BACT|nr:hypothetical protein CLG94_01740 [Candidatus Methylomirabilis limnetica]